MASLKIRGTNFYLQCYVAGRQRRFNLRTDSFQIAKEKLRQFEARHGATPHPTLPTRTPIPEVVQRYSEHLRTIKTGKSAQTDIYYLREVFGPVCPGITITSRKPSLKTKKRPPLRPDRRRRAPAIHADCFEAITTQQASAFIDEQVRARGLAPKTANRYREILVRLFNWAMSEGGVRVPDSRNPAKPVRRYRETAPQIRFLTLPQIDEQLAVLAKHPSLQTAVATFIYAGLRREELLWLTRDDVDWNGEVGILRIRAKTLDGQSWQPKTKVNRAVPIGSRLRAFLQKHQPDASTPGWLFPSPEGRRWDPDNFAAKLRELNAVAGLKWSNLDFRHTFGSQLAMKGVSLYKIATLMGNSPEICRRHYAALVPEALGDAVEF